MLKLIKGLHEFQDNLFSSQRALFERLAKGQTPDALFITWYPFTDCELILVNFGLLG